MTHYYVKAALGRGEEISPAGRTGGRQNAIEQAYGTGGKWDHGDEHAGTARGVQVLRAGQRRGPRAARGQPL